MPSIAQNSTVNISLAAGDYINVTGSGSWSYIATVSGREIASGSYVGHDVIGPFTKACSVGITCGPVALSYTTSDFVEGNVAAQAFTTEDVTSLKAVVSGDRKVPLYPVSARNGLLVNTASGDYAMSIRRSRKNGKVPVSNLRLRLCNWYVSNSTGAETANANDIKVACSIEYPVGAAPRPCYVNGVQDFIIPPGGTVDALEITGLTLPADAEFLVHLYARGWVAGAAGGSLPFGRYAQNSQSVARRDYAAFNASATDKTTTIGGETTAIASAKNLYSEFAVLGEPIIGAAMKPSVLVFGDSITYGLNEINGPFGDTWANTGPYERWLGGTHGLGMVNLGVSSISAANYAALTTAGMPRLLAAVRDVGTHAILALGRNDYGGTVDALTTNVTALAAYLTGAGIKCYGVTVTPRSTSTDSWATLENQTTDAGTNAKRLQWNALLRSAPPAGLRAVLEMADQMESSRDSGLLPVNGTANYYSSDGLHPSRFLNAVAAAALPDPLLFLA